jgi:3'-phosphoadenosine 5'-phosphosulfate sulfotransferase (PAPS reductase)/FAD synthetase
MPRPQNLRKNLSQGWKKLYQFWKWELDRKVDFSHSLLKRVFRDHQTPVVCWSGGKDSTVVLHLVRQYQADIPVIFVDSGVEFPDTLKFVQLLAESWNLNLTIARPKVGEDFWTVGSKYGWPIFGKNIAANVERAIRSKNIRPQMSPLEKILAINKIHISARCAEFLQEKPSKEEEKLLGADVKIVGLRASESRTRVRLWVDHGDYYFVKRYFGRNLGIWKANPIAIWKDEDIWKYHAKFGIPHSTGYDKGYSRNGCWTCAMGVRNGQLKRLRENDSKLFDYLMVRTEMGRELLRAKMLLVKGENLYLEKRDIKLLLKQHPDFLDTM